MEAAAVSTVFTVCWQSSRPWHIQCPWCNRQSLHWSESAVDAT